MKTSGARGAMVVYAVAAFAVLALLAVARFGGENAMVKDAVQWLRLTVGNQSQTALGMVLLAVAAFVASCLFFPLSATTVAICVAAPGWRAFMILYPSALAAALVTYWIWRHMKVPLPAWLVRQTGRLQARLQHGGFLPVLFARLVPVGSFTLINGVAGMLKVPFTGYALANVVGLLPGILVAALLSGRLAALWQKTSPRNVAVAAGAVVLLLGGLALLRHLVRKQSALSERSWSER